MFNRSRYFILLISLALSFVLATVVFADVTIDTNDGVVDANWPTTANLIDSTGKVDPEHDIVFAWADVDDSMSPTTYFFRTQTMGMIADSVEARLDCEANGNFDEATDGRVFYVPALDRVEVYPGDFSGFDTQSAEYGELVGTSAEWKVDAAKMGTCDPEVSTVFFRKLDGGLEADVTIPFPIDSTPSAVGLVSAETVTLSNTVILIGLLFLSIVSGRVIFKQ